MNIALITGITGQDGSFLSESLLKKGYEVHGVVRKHAMEAPDKYLGNLERVGSDIVLHEGSLTDPLGLTSILKEVQPTEVYHLAASSYVDYGLAGELSVMENNFNSTYNLLNSILRLNPKCRVFFAGSSEMFGDPDVAPQNEDHKFSPRSIYGISKTASFFLIKNFRLREGYFVCTGIMYNHESPRRGLQFVTRKISSTVAQIRLGLKSKLYLGNLDAKRDWGFAPDYVEAMWMMLQAEKPQDYVISSGKLHSVRDFLEISFRHVGLRYEDYVEVDPRFFRKPEKVPLVGDSSKIRSDLGWKNTKDFEDIVKEMVDHDLEALSKMKGL